MSQDAFTRPHPNKARPQMQHQDKNHNLLSGPVPASHLYNPAACILSPKKTFLPLLTNVGVFYNSFSYVGVTSIV